MLLENKVAVIHGGGGSIGGAAARVFAREGARLFLAGKSLPRLEAAASVARAEGAEVSIAVVDAMDQAAVDRHVDEVADAAGRIDIALNAVGFDHVQGLPIAETSLDDYLHPVVGYLQTNFVTAKAVSRHMIAQGSGVILTISTPGARLTGAGSSAMRPNRPGSRGSRARSPASSGPMGFGWSACVRTRCRMPSPPRTRATCSAARPRQAASPWMQWLTGLVGMTLLGRLPVLDEVAEYLAFAASDRARSMTGAIANLSAGALVD